jgi:hypothetical protein
MKCERAPDDLRDFCDWLFESIKTLGGPNGQRPAYQEKIGWYRSPPKGKLCLYLYVAGKQGKKHPNTVHLATLWTEEFRELPWVERGDAWYGSVSADFYADPRDPKAKERAIDFVHRAFKVVAVDTLQKEAVIEDPVAVTRDLEVVIANERDVMHAAGRIKNLLAKAGPATVAVVRDILVNVVSTTVIQVMFPK